MRLNGVNDPKQLVTATGESAIALEDSQLEDVQMLMEQELAELGIEGVVRPLSSYRIFIAILLEPAEPDVLAEQAQTMLRTIAHAVGFNTAGWAPRVTFQDSPIEGFLP